MLFLESAPFSDNKAESPLIDPPTFTVTALTTQIKRLLEGAWDHVRVRAEIGACTLHSSGHLYLTFKDQTNTLAAVCWRARVASLGFKPVTGMEVVATGRLTAYGGQSRYQLVVEQLERLGVGALLQQLEERKRKLTAEGLFASERKKTLPFLPTIIGVVTSPTGAVIRDIVHRLADRFPRHVLVWPTRVQGDGSAAMIAAAIAGFNAFSPHDPVKPRPDLLIVARGGGSLEDLMPFNDEAVVRAVAASTIPVITAVGHETDTTLVDYAGDCRAPTPTAAAEMAVPVRLDLMTRIMRDGERLDGLIRRKILEQKRHVAAMGRFLGNPEEVLSSPMQRVDDLGMRLTRAFVGRPRLFAATLANLTARLAPMIAMRINRSSDALAGHSATLTRLPVTIVRGAENRLAHAGAMLDALSPRSVLQRGYALVHHAAQGDLVTSVNQVVPSDRVCLEFADGTRDAVIAENAQALPQSLG